MTVDEVDRLTRRIEKNVYHKTGIILTGVGVYAYNTQGGRTAQIRNEIQNKVLAHDWALQLHGFYANLEEKTIRLTSYSALIFRAKKPLEFYLKKCNTCIPATRCKSRRTWTSAISSLVRRQDLFVM